MVAKYNPDMPTYWQASAGDKAKYWFEARNKEIDNLIKCNMWKVIPIRKNNSYYVGVKEKEKP
eukprot:10201644-Ditylum_brightwellii.AAC.1